MTTRGLIQQVYHANCGMCDRTAILPARLFREATGEARAKGWEYTDSHGWVCGDCFASIMPPALNAETIRNEVGARIRARRLERGVRQVELAHRIETTRSSVANMEAGRQNISLDQLSQIARSLQCTVADLLPAELGGTPDET